MQWNITSVSRTRKQTIVVVFLFSGWSCWHMHYGFSSLLRTRASRHFEHSVFETTNIIPCPYFYSAFLWCKHRRIDRLSVLPAFGHIDFEHLDFFSDRYSVVAYFCPPFRLHSWFPSVQQFLFLCSVLIRFKHVVTSFISFELTYARGRCNEKLSTRDAEELRH